MSRLLRLGLAALTALSACGVEEESRPHAGIALGEALAPGSADFKVCASGPTLEGVDVSHYDGTIDWTKVAAAGKVFAWSKATEGVTYEDPMFQTNWAGMKSAGVVRGAYHFFRPQDNGTQQADWYLARVGAFSPGNLPPTLDWETTDSVSTATDLLEAQRFIDEIRLQTGLTTVIYSSKRFLALVGSPTQFSGLPLWDANWQVTCPTIPDAWTTWTFWQYSSTGTVAGIGPNVDLSVFNGTASDLEALTGAGGADGGSDGGPAPDAGAGDAGIDAGQPDAGDADAGGADAGTPDAGETDAGSVDAGAGADAGGAHDGGVNDGDGGHVTTSAPQGGCGSAPASGGTLELTFLLLGASALVRARQRSARPVR